MVWPYVGELMLGTADVYITTYSDRRDYNATITILYTKASDSVDDPVRLVGGGSGGD